MYAAHKDPKPTNLPPTKTRGRSRSVPYWLGGTDVPSLGAALSVPPINASAYTAGSSASCSPPAAAAHVMGLETPPPI